MPMNKRPFSFETSNEDDNFSWETHSRMPLAEALRLGIPSQNTTVYKLEVGGGVYIGLTTTAPEKALEEHLEAANAGSKRPVHVELRRFGGVNELEVIKEYSNEVLALVGKISAIKIHGASLNATKGYEGANYRIFERKNSKNEDILWVENIGKQKDHEQSVASVKEKASELWNSFREEHLVFCSSNDLNIYDSFEKAAYSESGFEKKMITAASTPSDLERLEALIAKTIDALRDENGETLKEAQKIFKEQNEINLSDLEDFSKKQLKRVPLGMLSKKPNRLFKSFRLLHGKDEMALASGRVTEGKRLGVFEPGDLIIFRTDYIGFWENIFYFNFFIEPDGSITEQRTKN
jgi:hypothetical protein